MKKKWILAIAVAVAVAGCVAAAIWARYGMDGSGNITDPRMDSSGRYILTENGMHLIILDNSPVVMSGEASLFEGLQTGDEIAIRHGLIRETYPGGTDVYQCTRVSQGSLEDIPREILQSICPMGYVPVDPQGVTREVYTGKVVSVTDKGFALMLEGLFEQELSVNVPPQAVCAYENGLSSHDLLRIECTKDSAGNLTAQTVVELLPVSYAYGYGNMSLTLEADWEYEILPYSDDAVSFGIAFRPEVQDGWIKVLFYPQDEFGVCGTGLVTRRIPWSTGMTASLNTYDNNPYWDFITFQQLPGTYVVMTENVRGWSQEQMDKAMEYLLAAELAKGYARKNGIMEHAKSQCDEEMDIWRTYFDCCTGQWTVSLQNGDDRCILTYSIEGQLLDRQDSDEPIAVPEKPVIYLYPEEEMEVSVELLFDGRLTATYPKYNNGWKVLAKPDGMLKDLSTERDYYCLFWEGIADTTYDFSQGFVVAGEDTEAFLEDTLRKLGLTDREANEFIIYWVPRMQGNAFNLISFQQESYTDSAVLNIDPMPDTLIRVFMAWKSLEEVIQIQPQVLTAVERQGFTVVEWGAAEVTE